MTGALVDGPTGGVPRAVDRRRGRKLPSSAARNALALATLVAAIASWQVLVDSGAVNVEAVASPSSIVRAARPLLGESATWSALGSTLLTWSAGWLISLAIAVPVGMAIGSSLLAYRLTRLSIDVLRTIPPVALLPLALLLYGATDRMAIELIVFGSAWPVLLQSMYGVHQIDPVARDVARAYRWRRGHRIRYLVFPSAAPFVATGARLAATTSLLLAIGTEVIGGAPGLGNQITISEQTNDVPSMFVFVTVSAVLGIAVNVALRAVERRLLWWHSSYRPAQS